MTATTAPQTTAGGSPRPANHDLGVRLLWALMDKLHELGWRRVAVDTLESTEIPFPRLRHHYTAGQWELTRTCDGQSTVVWFETTYPEFMPVIPMLAEFAQTGRTDFDGSALAVRP